MVRDAFALLATLKRLHILDDGVLFWNEQRTFKIMLRNDPVDSETLACELAIIIDEDDDALAKILEMCSDGYMEDSCTYVAHTWSFPMEHFTVEEAAKIMHVLNEVHQYRACDCGKYIIKDEGTMCYFCQMTSSAPDRECHFCPICCEDGVAMHMVEQPCCKQRLHTRCLKTWKSKSNNDRCPFCRG